MTRSIFARWIVERHFSHDGETIRVFLRGLERVVVAIAFPGRRHEDDAIDPGGFHLLKQTIVGQRNRPVGPRSVFRDIRSLRGFRRPDVHLCVNDGHGKVRALGNRRQAIVNPGFRKNYRLLFAAVHLTHETVVEKLRGFSGLGFRNRIRKKIQDTLQPRF